MCLICMNRLAICAKIHEETSDLHIAVGDNIFYQSSVNVSGQTLKKTKIDQIMFSFSAAQS